MSRTRKRRRSKHRPYAETKPVTKSRKQVRSTERQVLKEKWK